MRLKPQMTQMAQINAEKKNLCSVFSFGIGEGRAEGSLAVVWSAAASRRFPNGGSPPFTAQGRAPAIKSGGKPPHSKGLRNNGWDYGLRMRDVGTMGLAVVPKKSKESL